MAFIEWCLKAGRLGGAVMIACGVAVLGFCHWDVHTNQAYFPALVGLGIILLLIGLALLIFGNPGASPIKSSLETKTRHSKRAQSNISIDNFKRELAKHSFPYTICLIHRRVVANSKEDVLSGRWEKDSCAMCNPALDLLAIENEEDLSLALASLE